MGRWGSRRVAAIVALSAFAFLAAGCVPPPPPPPPNPPNLVLSPAHTRAYSDSSLHLSSRTSITVTNAGGSPSAPIQIRKYGFTKWGSWALTDDGCSNVVLAVGASCALNIWFTSQQWFGFSESGMYEITGGVNPVYTDITGRAIPTLAYFTELFENPFLVPATIEDSATSPGPGSLSVMVFNGSSTTFKITAGLLTASIDTAPGSSGAFTIGPTDTCTGHWLQPGDHCWLDIQYDNPTGLGAGDGVVHVAWPDGDAAMPIHGQATS